MDKDSYSLAVVLPRYGASIGGGAETLVRELILALAAHSGQLADGGDRAFRSLARIEVWTTCAQDHRTWENFHSPGVTVEDGITVRRFLVDPRDLEIFINAEMTMAQGLSLTTDQQLDWLSQGVNSRELYRHIAAHSSEFDAVLFAPYLFPTTFWGALIDPSRSIIIPCLHNEAYAYLEVFRQLLSRVRGLIFNASAELDLAVGLYGEELRSKATVVGMGFSAPAGEAPAGEALVGEALVGEALAEEAPAGEAPAGEAEVEAKPFLLYSGRKETGKSLDLLIDCFVKYKAGRPNSPLELRMIGSGSIDFLSELPPAVIDLGFVSEEEKERLMRTALALCQPSVNESFSIVIMEAWLRQTPVLVHERCAVTVEHVRSSNGGLYFSNSAEFAAVIEQLCQRPELCKALAVAGHTYVKEQYNWNAVVRRFETALEKVGIFSATDEAMLLEHVR